jgi:hypothetical protein
MIRKARIGFVALFAGIAMQPCIAGEPLPLFQDDEVVKAVLTAPIAQAFSQKNNGTRIYLPGQWSYVDEAGNNQKLDVSIRTRGHFRREHCDRAPLQLNFKKKQVAGTLFDGQNKLKLVAPCFRGSEYQRLIILEYLAYKSLEILTDYSFKTRLIRLGYVDSEEKLKPWTSLTFVIEDDSDMASRLELERARVTSVEFAELDREKAALAELFQLLIGNTDYSVLKGEEENKCCHNSEILVDNESGLKIPVPYDFDMSGMVDAPYAGPAQHVPIESVTDRYYLGLCHPPGIVEAEIVKLQGKQDEIVELFEQFPALSTLNRNHALKYINEFYRILESEKQSRSKIYDQCRGQHLLDKMMEAAKDSA